MKVQFRCWKRKNKEKQAGMEVDDKTTSSKLIMSAKKDQKFIWNRISTAFAPKKRYMHTMTEFGNALVVFVRFICLNQ